MVWKKSWMIPSTTGSIRLILLAFSLASSQLPGRSWQPSRIVLRNWNMHFRNYLIHEIGFNWRPASPVLGVETKDGQDEGEHPHAETRLLLILVAESCGEQDGQSDGDRHEQTKKQVSLTQTLHWSIKLNWVCKKIGHTILYAFWIRMVWLEKVPL